MGFTPLRTKVLLEVDAEDRRIGAMKLLLPPDQDYIKHCRRCGALMQSIAITKPCTIHEEWQIDTYRDQPKLVDIHASHEVIVEKQDVIIENCRLGTVLAIGPSVREVAVGDRVAIYCQAGLTVPGSPYRLVPEEAILGWVEMEA